MTPEPRRALVEAFAKINLGLKVLHRRPDGYHELRTVYQTISLADRLEIRFLPARRTRLRLVSDPEIPGNLALSAARAVLSAMRTAGEVELRLQKRIPMGAGLGGGSSDAAAVLLALPALAGRRLGLDALIRLASELGSDVPLFLLGGTTLGLGRGSEVYPLADLPRSRGLLVVPQARVSTAEAYAALGRGLTNDLAGNKLNSFQSCVWSTGAGVPGEASPAFAGNDFEAAIFRQHPRLRGIKTRLRKLGAAHALLTGSGSAVYGLFQAGEELQAALPHFQKELTIPFEFVSRDRYRALWRRSLRPHIEEGLWPPQRRDAS